MDPTLAYAVGTQAYMRIKSTVETTHQAGQDRDRVLTGLVAGA